MSTGRLVINGKTWGEFESAKRIKGHIVISGYESYGGCHTVRGIKQPELNENQKTVLNWLKESCKLYGLREVIEIIGFLPTTGGKMKYKQAAYAYGDLNDDELAQVLQTFSQWTLEQEEAE
ncbi:hypothetical protein [Enterococcus faecalis]|uniref:hypothetical protein n=1 Tax=Enterococcus faecalis TaxID=1351 RepID=UPI0003313657|nr:hypothetical protein [Enterococcus faecalis]EOK05366.1 hypothetical protein WOS_01332 [Enterococcus faecalis EnGen0367]